MDLQLSGKVAVVTGAGGAIGGAIATQLAAEGVKVAIWEISRASAATQCETMQRRGAATMACCCDVTDRVSVRKALATTIDAFGTVDILVNAAGGSRPEATAGTNVSFFDIDDQAMQHVLALNYLGAVLPSQAVGRLLAEKGEGCIVNIGSVAGGRPLTQAVSYSNAKAAVASFTQWLAVHMAQEYSPQIRVNAIAPGFVLTDQNRFLLVDSTTGELTARGQKVNSQVPMNRYGMPEEVAGLVLWLASPLASFMTGAVIPVDGGFSAYAGV